MLIPIIIKKYFSGSMLFNFIIRRINSPGKIVRNKNPQICLINRISKYMLKFVTKININTGKRTPLILNVFCSLIIEITYAMEQFYIFFNYSNEIMFSI